MRAWDTFFIVPPITPRAWVQAVFVVGAFLLVQERQGNALGLDLAPLSVAFVAYLLLVVAKNAARTFDFLGRQDGAWIYALMIYGLIFGLLGLCLVAGPHVGGLLWTSFFVMQCGMMLFLARFDVGFLASHIGVKEPFAPVFGQVAALTHAVMAASLAALIAAGWYFEFVVVATFGWLCVHFLGNWIAVLIVQDADEHLDL